jgi:type III pantothenate kinase
MCQICSTHYSYYTSMLLAIDIGNTSVSCGIFKRNAIIKRFKIPANRYSLSLLKRNIKGHFINACIICSVVPALTRRIEKDARKISYKTPYVVGSNIKIPVKNRYRHPKQVGGDRLVNTFAGIILYGAPLIIIDFGTAVTVDVISRKEEYLGGMILPGIGLSLSTLNKNTALLPKVSITPAREFIGRDTISSMISGITHGMAYAADAFIMQLRKKLGRDTRIIATGADAPLISRYSSLIKKVDVDLTLKGLRLLEDSRHGSS